MRLKIGIVYYYTPFYTYNRTRACNRMKSKSNFTTTGAAAAAAAVTYNVLIS